MILPDLEELVALRGIAQGLDLHAHRPAIARLFGSHRSAQRGRGLEFEEVRPYAQGDDVRHIDWRVTARRGSPHTKLFREERERPVWLVLDLHAGLFFGSKRQLKSALLLRVAAILAWIAVSGGDRVGAIITRESGTPLIFPPRAREAGVLPTLQALVDMQPRVPKVPEHSSLQTTFTALRHVIKPSSLVLVVSDFSGLDTASEHALSALATHSDCRMLWITDPLERTGLPAGTYRVGLPNRLWWLDGKNSRHPWHEAWQKRKQALTALSLRLNVPLISLDTADAVAETLPALLREPIWAA
jgi:uncharacterized protein (DUF58 family)